MADEIGQCGIYRASDGHLIANYLAPDGTRAQIDLTAEITRIAAEMVKTHERNYHGG